jgi:DNA repair and recombination protein RAD52
MFNDKQTQALSYEIDSSRVKNRSKGNINFSYLEGFDIIETANKIFGYGNWSYAITSLSQASQELNHNQNHVICYKSVVNITVYDTHHVKHISREDVGFGSGIAKSLAEAHESGAKEAVTDAIKRAMRSFGNQFGNSLYDKSRNNNHNQSYNQQPQPQMQQIPNQHYQQATPNNQTYSHNPNDYSSLYNIGLQVLDNGNGSLVITGDDIFSKKDSIKACGFRWDTNSKMWYKPIEQQVA